MRLARRLARGAETRAYARAAALVDGIRPAATFEDRGDRGYGAASSGEACGSPAEAAEDPHLAALLAAWKRLDDRARAALLQTAEALARA